MRRSLGSLDAAALVVSNVIGVGIFTAPGVVAHMAPRSWAVLAMWAAGGLLALGGALAYAELARLRPYAGAEYVYLHEAFGPLAGFLSGWTSFVAGFSGAIAAGAVGLASYLGAFFPSWGSAEPLFTALIVVSPRSVAAVIVILGFALMHVLGLGVGRIVQTALAALNVFTLAALIIAGFLSSPTATAPLQLSGEFTWAACILALIPVMFTYSGWNAAAYVAEEIREPERNIRRALIGGTAVIAVLYLGLNLLYLYALGPRLDGVVNAGNAAAGALFGATVAKLMTVLVILALAGSVSAMVVAGPRVYFAMARDGLFLPAMARVGRRSRAPGVAILAQALWSVLLVLTGTFEQLLIYTGLAITVFSSLAVVSLFVLRRRTGARPSRLVTAGSVLFVLATLMMVTVGIVQQPRTAGTALAVIGAGVPVYWWFNRRSRAVLSPGQVSG